MAISPLRQVIQTLRGASLRHEGAGPTDGQLLASYVRGRDEAAFAALVHRHGPMVWGVCCRVLGSPHDAEDAFQATFLVLVRKAPSLAQGERVANWLYGVAHLTARKARATAARRRTREKQVTAMPEPALEQRHLWDDLQPLLDQELSRLPDKYRAVIVLCGLEGKTRKEAARHLNVPEGTVASRLATARTMLGKRLARSGLAVSGVALAAVLSENGASAGLPASVASSTIQAASLFAAGQAAAPGVLSGKAVALAEGVLKTMLLTRLKIATAVVLTVAVFGAGAAALTQQVLAGKPADQPVTEKQGPANRPVTEKKPSEPGTTIVSGIVKAVDAEKDTLTIAHREGDKTFTVANDTTIVLNGKPGNLARLPKGALAGVSLGADATTARSIEAVGPQLGGVVTAVDAEKRTLTVTVAQGGGEKTFTLTRGATIVIDGKPGKLAALPPGANVTLSWFADLQTARNLEAVGPTWQGIRVKAVDGQNNTITIDENQREVELAGKTLPVAKDANIVIDGKPGKIAGVPPGTAVTLNLGADQKTVRGLEATGRWFPIVEVKAVDAAKNTITFDDRQPPELAGKTFPVATDVWILVDTKPTRLAGVPPGAIVGLGLSVDQKTVRLLFAEGRRFQDVRVKAVDAAQNTVTFGDEKTPAELAGKTIPVAAEATIEIDGKRSKLAAVPAGAFVTLTLTADQQAVRLLNAYGPQFGNPSGVVVVAVDADKNTITVDIPEEGEKTFPLAKGATVEVDGKPGKLALVPREAFVILTLSVDQKTVRALQAKGLETNDVVVKAVDAVKNTITFADDARPAQVAGRTLPVAKGAEIAVDGKPGKLAEVPPGASVWLWLSVDQNTVIRLHAGGAQLGGFGGVVLQAVDADKSTITVDIREEGEKTFPVAKDARIEIDGKPARLAALPKEAAVILALGADQKTVRSIQAKTQ